MLGDPELALARMTKPLDAGMEIVVVAVPAEVSTRACPPEALRFETIRPEPDDARVIFSDSTDVVGEVVLAAALLVAVSGTGMAANLSRRFRTSPTAANVSAGTVGVLSEAVLDTVVRAVLIAGVIDEVPTGAEVMADAGVGSSSIARVPDRATDVTAAARRLAVAGGTAVFWDDLLVPDAVDPVAACEAAACADPDDDELEPPVSAQATGPPSPVAIAVPIPSAAAKAPTLPTDMLAVEIVRVV
jgi:hypothetical protein